MHVYIYVNINIDGHIDQWVVYTSECSRPAHYQTQQHTYLKRLCSLGHLLSVYQDVLAYNIQCIGLSLCALGVLACFKRWAWWGAELFLLSHSEMPVREIPSKERAIVSSSMLSETIPLREVIDIALSCLAFFFAAIATALIFCSSVPQYLCACIRVSLLCKHIMLLCIHTYMDTHVVIYFENIYINIDLYIWTYAFICMHTNGYIHM